MCEHFGLPEVAAYWDQVVSINKWQQYRIYEMVINKLFGNVNKKKIAILGFAFKADTNDTRESSAIKICRDLLDEGANLIIHDPKVKVEQIEKDLVNKSCTEKEQLNNTIDEHIEELQKKIKEHNDLQEIHDELQGKHEELQGIHEDLKEEHIKIKLLTNGSEEMKMEVIDTSNL